MKKRYPKILLEVERELKADWKYHDWDREAVDTIRKLAKALRKAIDKSQELLIQQTKREEIEKDLLIQKTIIEHEIYGKGNGK